MIEHMFDIVLTQSGKQAQIPTQHAVNYFPPLDLEEAGRNYIELIFKERNGKRWKFYYRYWKNTQRYVMTKGWRRFVKLKQLVAGDTVSFHCRYIPGPERRQKYMIIDWRHKEVNLTRLLTGDFQGRENLRLNVNGESHSAGSPLDDRSVPLVHPSEPSQPLKKIKLFGVDIEESSSGETRGQIGVTGCTSSSPPVIRDDGQLSRRSPSGKMGASSSK